MTKAPTTTPTPEGDRIAKVLSRAGVASRREAERMIAAGEVAGEALGEGLRLLPAGARLGRRPQVDHRRDAAGGRCASRQRCGLRPVRRLKKREK